MPLTSRAALAPSLPAIVRRSLIHGRGLFAAQNFAAGACVAEYRGERLSKAESLRRQRARRRTWIFELNSRTDVDGFAPGNPARFLNHSCAPNCEVVAEGGKLWVRAMRDIAPGEELTFDYGFRLSAFAGHRCRCGAAGCAGFIVAQPERRRLRKLLGGRGHSLLARKSATEAGQ